MNDQELEAAVEGRTLVLTGTDILRLITVLGTANVAFQVMGQRIPEIAEESYESRTLCGDVLKAVMRQHPDLVEELYGFQPKFVLGVNNVWTV